jgi:hypothetical protein
VKRIALLTISGLFIAQLVFAEDFWLTKKYTQWTQDEVLKMMKDSPWAKKISVSLSAPNADPGHIFGTSDTAMDSAMTRPPMAGAAATMVIGWRSSLPLKEALLRGLTLAGQNTAAAAGTLSNPETDYIIVVSDVPLDIGRAAQQSEAAQQSTLKSGKKDPIHPIAVNFEAHAQTMDIFVAFPRTEAIVLEDDEVEIDIKLGTFDAKEKFKLKDMQFNGKLEL